MVFNNHWSIEIKLNVNILFLHQNLYNFTKQKLHKSLLSVAQPALSVRRGKVKEPSQFFAFSSQFFLFFPLFFPIFGKFFTVRGHTLPPLAPQWLRHCLLYVRPLMYWPHQREDKVVWSIHHCNDTISYSLFVHAIRKDTYGLVLYHMRPYAECDTAPIHRYFPYCVRTNRV